MTKWTKVVFESKICAECENKFIPIRHRQKTCFNKECRKQSRKKYNQKNKRPRRGASFLGVNIKKSAKNRKILFIPFDHISNLTTLRRSCPEQSEF